MWQGIEVKEIMCELFGVNAPGKIQLNALLETFFSHSAQHPHGWGMAFFEENPVRIVKQPLTASKSLRLRECLEKDIASDNMIAHIRLATKGNMEQENCHPFVMEDDAGRTWTLAHNGTIFEGETLDSYFYVQEGQTDSERILCHIIEQVNGRQRKEGRPLTGEERFHLLDEIVCNIAGENKLNLLIYDGEYLYVHTNCRDSLYASPRGGGKLFSTVPLDEGEWESLPLNTLLAYQRGRLMFRGTDHGFEFIEDPEKMRLLFLDFSVL